MNRGWAAYLTLDSAEANLRPDGTPKIDVNKDNLEELHKELKEVLGKEMANFIVAYRQGGAYDGDETGQSASAIQLDLKQPGRQKLTTILDLIGVKTRISRQPQSRPRRPESKRRRRRELAGRTTTAASSSTRRSPTIAARCRRICRS